ncbi:MAG: hypothetical protein ACI9S6_003602, partial [Reinekea sp.]
DVHRIADAIAEVATGKATNTNSLNFAPVPNIWQSLLS